ncbi:hypothetical protein [Caballeronia sp. RCC_10]|uniref:hypothetical protein n=1 Tax=Caballeronia sp. RCC_10 TaxID=3239227 RepID=UPI0035262A69
MPVLFVVRKGLKRLESKFDTNIWAMSLDNVVEVVGHPDCPHITDGLEVGRAYQFEEEQWFAVGRKRREFYKRMEQLAELVGYNWRAAGADAPGPFRELFRHPGEFGTIGPVASAKLAADFAAWDVRALALGKRFYSWFGLMSKMFDYAKNDGAVWQQ